VYSETPFTWEELVKNILEPAYNGTAKDEQVAFLFVLLAIGTSQDHEKQPDNSVARRYAHLARISLMLGEDLLCTKSLIVISCLVCLLCSLTYFADKPFELSMALLRGIRVPWIPRVLLRPGCSLRWPYAWRKLSVLQIG
jgi:hypothetical protein